MPQPIGLLSRSLGQGVVPQLGWGPDGMRCVSWNHYYIACVHGVINMPQPRATRSRICFEFRLAVLAAIFGVRRECSQGELPQMSIHVSHHVTTSGSNDTFAKRAFRGIPSGMSFVDCLQMFFPHVTGFKGPEVTAT